VVLCMALLFVVSMAKKKTDKDVSAKKNIGKKDSQKKHFFGGNIDQIFDSDESEAFEHNNGPPPNGFGNGFNVGPPFPNPPSGGVSLNGFQQGPGLDFLDDDEDRSADITSDPEFLGVIDPTFFAGPKLPNTTAFINLNTQFLKLLPCMTLFVEKGLTSVYASQQGELFLAYINHGATVPANCHELNNADASANYASGYRISIILQDGNVIYDSYYHRNVSAVPDNQNPSPEVMDAILNRNEGFATRVSQITGLKTIYIAKTLFKEFDKTQFITIRAAQGLPN